MAHRMTVQAILLQNAEAVVDTPEDLIPGELV